MEELEFEYGFLDGTVNLTLDRSKFTEEMAKAVISFSDWDIDEDNDVVTEVCRKIAYIVFWIATKEGYNTQGILNNQNRFEGLPSLDGTVGITLTYVEGLEIDESEFKLKE